MDKHAIWSTFRAKPGKEEDVERFLEECRQSIQNEKGTTTFFAIKIGPGQYATFNTFQDDAAVAQHIHGPTAAAVKQRQPELFDGNMQLAQGSILAAKE